MDGKRQFDGHLQAVAVGHEARAASQPVGHERPRIDVVIVVVLATAGTYHAVGSTRPLGHVARTFKAAGQSAELAATFDVAHSSAEAHRIGCHHTLVVRLVGQHHSVEGVVSLVKLKGAEVHPRASAHLLVHPELRLLPLVVHRVVGIVDASLQRLVAHVDGIAAFLHEIRLIARRAHVLGRRRGGNHACRSLSKGVLTVGIPALMKRKTGAWTGGPGIAPVALAVGEGCVAEVVVDYYLLALPVALARSEHHSTGFLEHRYEVRHHDGLREQVFGGAEQVWPLPLPHAAPNVVVATVA